MQEQLQSRVQRFVPAFEQVVVLVQSRVRYPADLDKMRRDEVTDFRRSRYSTADVLEDAAGDLSLPSLCLHRPMRVSWQWPVQ